MKTTDQLPSPSLSTLAQTLGFLRDPFTLIRKSQAELGDVFALRLLGLGTWVFLCSPELVREMFKAPTDVLVAGELNTRTLGFMLGRDATFTLDGDAHRERHRIVHPLLNGRRVHRYLDTMLDVTDQAITRWPRDRPFAFLAEAHRISLEVLVRSMFHQEFGHRPEKIVEIFDEFATRGLRSPLIAMPFLQIDLGRFSPWGRIQRMRKAVRQALMAEVLHRLPQRGQDLEAEADIVHALINAEQRDGQSLSEEALVDEIINLLFAGHETTGSILTWTLECLLAHPDVLARVLEELRTVVGDERITPEHLSQLEYLNAVVQEGIRYRPIAPMAGIRLVKEPYRIGEHLLPQGAVVTQCFPAMACRPDLFDHPDRFDPQHFFQRKFKPFEWNPFGGGTRMCIGRGLAEVELRIVLARVLQSVELGMAQKDVSPVRNGHFFVPSQGLQVRVLRDL